MSYTVPSVLVRLVGCILLFLSEMSFNMNSDQAKVCPWPQHYSSETLRVRNVIIKISLSFQWQTVGFKFTKSGGEEESRRTEGIIG